MDKKYHVYISPNYFDSKEEWHIIRRIREERGVVIESTLNAGFIPTGMFGLERVIPASDDILESFKKFIDNCDYYLIIFGVQYITCSITEEKFNFIEKEYEYALSKNKTVLALIKGDPGDTYSYANCSPKLGEKLKQFKEKITQASIVEYWHSYKGLNINTLSILEDAKESYPAKGWSRGDLYCM